MIRTVCTADGKLLDSLIGSNVFVRTVTHHFTGRLTAADEHFLLLDDAAWIADDGRFADCLATGSCLEVEPYPGSCLVAIGSLVDVSEWRHELPRKQR